MSALPFAGCRFLVVEDQYMIADELTRMLEQLGAEVLGPFARAETALAALEMRPGRQPDAALLDINLRGVPVFPAAEALRTRGVPILFLTSYGPAVLPPRLQGLPCLHKPVDPRQLTQALLQILGPRPG